MPSTSCRKGLVVHLVNAMGMQVPVRIKLSALATSDSAAMCHVVQVGGCCGNWRAACSLGRPFPPTAQPEVTNKRPRCATWCRWNS